MSYWQLFYHIVWSTAHREPLITPDVEEVIYGLLRGKAVGLGGSVWALNGTCDHVHMVASIPPTIAVSRFAGQVKGVAATRFNKMRTRETPLYWQGEYGVFSFDAKRLPNFVAYVERQKEHQAAGTPIPVLERTAEGGVRVVRETPTDYAAGYSGWWREMQAIVDSGGNSAHT